MLHNRWVWLSVGIIAGAYLYSHTQILDWLPGVGPATPPTS